MQSPPHWLTSPTFYLPELFLHLHKTLNPTTQLSAGLGIYAVHCSLPNNCELDAPGGIGSTFQGHIHTRETDLSPPSMHTDPSVPVPLLLTTSHHENSGPGINFTFLSHAKDPSDMKKVGCLAFSYGHHRKLQAAFLGWVSVETTALTPSALWLYSSCRRQAPPREFSLSSCYSWFQQRLCQAWASFNVRGTNTQDCHLF